MLRTTVLSAVMAMAVPLSLGVGALLNRVEDKGLIFVIGAGTVGLSAVAWLFLRRSDAALAPVAAGAPGH